MAGTPRKQNQPEQALRSGDVEALINTWENDSYSRYRPEKSVWNLYLLAPVCRVRWL